MTARLRELSRRLDQYCARLNSGLTAVAVVLAGIALAVAIGHLQQYRDPATAEPYAGVVGNE